MKLRYCTLVVLLCLSAVAPVCNSQTSRQSKHRAQTQALVVGWHDEFNSLEGWSSWTRSGATDIVSGLNGVLRVTLGSTSHFFKEYSHYRAGVWKEFDVDLNRYPVLAVRASRFQDAASWDVEVFEFRDKSAPNAHDTSKGGSVPLPDNPGNLVADRVANSGARNMAETVFVDVQPNPNVKRQGKSHVRLMLNLSGPRHGAFVDYAWARFIPREEVESVRNNPRSLHVKVTER